MIRTALIASLLLLSGVAMAGWQGGSVFGGSPELQPFHRNQVGSSSPVLLRALFSAAQTGAYSTYTAATGQSITDSRNSSATYFNNTTLETAGANQLRVEALPDGGGGALIEFASENYILRSGDLSNAAWSNDNMTVTGNQGVFVDGTTTMAELTATSATAYTYQLGTPNTTSVVASCWVAAVSGTQTATVIAASTMTSTLSCACATNNPSISCTSSAGGPVGTLGNYCKGVATVGTTPTRIETTVVVPSGGAMALAALPGTFGASGGQSIYVGGCQLEALPLATSYMATAGTTVSRPADVVSLTNPGVLTGPWCMGATIGSYWAQSFSTTAAGVMAAGASHAGANSTELSISTSLGDTEVVYDHLASSKTARYTLSNANPVTLLSCASSGTLTQWVNGTLESSGITGSGAGTLASNPSTLYLGSGAGGGTQWAEGYLRNVLLCSSSNGAVCQ